MHNACNQLLPQLQWRSGSTRGPCSYLMVIILSPFLSFCLSTSMCAPVTSWMAVMLQPPRPMIRDTTEAGTDSFFDLEKKQGNAVSYASVTLT